MKAIEQYFHVVLFIMLYKVGLTFRSVDETLACDHSNEGYQAVLSFHTVYFNKTLNGNPYHDPLSRFILIYKDMIWGDIVEH